MLAWSFSARTPDEVAGLLRALGKHRYVREVDHRIHFTLDEALAPLEPFAAHHAAFEAKRASAKDVDLSSRDPALFRPASTDEVILALSVFWTPGDEALRARERLLEAIARTGLPAAEHPPFECPADDPPHPEVVLLDWELHPVDELDVERHRGALEAMEDSGEEVAAQEPIHHEGPILAAPELCFGASNGVLPVDFLVWADGPYTYSDYVFRGVARAAKLLDPPVGYRDL